MIFFKVDESAKEQGPTDVIMWRSARRTARKRSTFFKGKEMAGRQVD